MSFRLAVSFLVVVFSVLCLVHGHAIPPSNKSEEMLDFVMDIRRLTGFDSIAFPRLVYCNIGGSHHWSSKQGLHER